MSSRIRTVFVCLTLAFLIASAAPAERKIVEVPGSDVGLPFSPAVWMGDLLLLSGALGNQPGTVIVEGDTAAQTRQTLANLEAVLKAADLDMSRVVSIENYLSDLRYLPEFHAELAKHLTTAQPANVTVQADVALPNARLEVAMVAARRGAKIEHIQPKGWVARPGSWAVRVGNTLLTSGMSSLAPKTGARVAGDVSVQAKQAMTNLGAVLEAAGMTYDDLVHCRVFLPDARDYGAMNEAYGSFLGKQPPSRATVRAQLVDPEARIEVQCTAVKAENRKVVMAAGSKPSGRPFSPAIQAGDGLFLAGMVGRAEDGYPPSIEAQTRVTLERLAATLKAAELTFADVAMATVWLSDIRDYSAMNAVYREVVGSPPPARATVGMQLMSPQAKVEIQMTAIAKD